MIVGLDNAGKTTILYQFLMNEVVTTSPTIGSNVEEVVWKNIHFIMWDLGGQQSLRAAWATYYTNTEVRTFYMSDNWELCVVSTSWEFPANQDYVKYFRGKSWAYPGVLMNMSGIPVTKISRHNSV